MNLIEQLCGYEKANSKLLKMDRILKEVYYSHSDAQKADELRQALLEYRRENNIFEVGDKVVLNDSNKSKQIFEVYFLRANRGNQHVSAKTSIKIIGLEDMIEMLFFNYGFNMSPEIRHITHKELEAGHRI